MNKYLMTCFLLSAVFGAEDLQDKKRPVMKHFSQNIKKRKFSDDQDVNNEMSRIMEEINASDTNGNYSEAFLRYAPAIASYSNILKNVDDGLNSPEKQEELFYLVLNGLYQAGVILRPDFLQYSDYEKNLNSSVERMLDDSMLKETIDHVFSRRTNIFATALLITERMVQTAQGGMIGGGIDLDDQRYDGRFAERLKRPFTNQEEIMHPTLTELLSAIKISQDVLYMMVREKISEEMFLDSERNNLVFLKNSEAFAEQYIKRITREKDTLETQIRARALDRRVGSISSEGISGLLDSSPHKLRAFLPITDEVSDLSDVSGKSSVDEGVFLSVNGYGAKPKKKNNKAENKTEIEKEGCLNKCNVF